MPREKYALFSAETVDGKEMVDGKNAYPAISKYAKNPTIANNAKMAANPDLWGENPEFLRINVIKPKLFIFTGKCATRRTLQNFC